MFNEPFVIPSLDIKKLLKWAKYLQKFEKALWNKFNFIFNKIEKLILFLIFDIDTKIIRFSLIEVSYSDRNIPQIWAVNFRNHISKIFGSLQEIDSSGNFTIFFTSITEKISLYADIAKENIRYSKLLQDAKYKKLIENT